MCVKDMGKKTLDSTVVRDEEKKKRCYSTEDKQKTFLVLAGTLVCVLYPSSLPLHVGAGERGCGCVYFSFAFPQKKKKATAVM